MQNNNSQTQEYNAFAQWEIGHEGFEFVPLVEPENAFRLSKQDEIVAFAPVLVESKIGEEHKIEPNWPQSAVLKEDSYGQTLIEASEEAKEVLRSNPLSDYMSAFKEKTLYEEGSRFIKNQQLLGGVALRKTEQGIEAGIAVAGRFLIISSGKAYNVAPQSLGELRHGGSNEAIDQRKQKVTSVLQAVIIEALPQEHEMRNSLNGSVAQTEAAAL